MMKTYIVTILKVNWSISWILKAVWFSFPSIKAVWDPKLKLEQKLIFKTSLGLPCYYSSNYNKGQDMRENMKCKRKSNVPHVWEYSTWKERADLSQVDTELCSKMYVIMLRGFILVPRTIKNTFKKFQTWRYHRQTTFFRSSLQFYKESKPEKGQDLQSILSGFILFLFVTI